MPTEGTAGTHLSKEKLLDILNEIDAERQQNRTNTPDQQNKNSFKSETSKSL